MLATLNEIAQQQLLDQLPCCIYLCNANGQCRYTNTALQTLFGLSQIECLGYGWLKRLHPEDAVYEQWQKALATGREFEISFRILKANHEVRCLRSKTRPIWDAHGQISGYIGCVEDHPLTTALNMQEQDDSRFYTIIKASPVPNAIYDTEGKVIYLNPAFSRTFGYFLDDIPKLEDWWSQAYPDPAYRQWVIEQSLLPQTDDYVFPTLELRLCCKDGLYKTVTVNRTLLPFEHAILITLLDLTELHQQKITLQERAQRYRQLFDNADLSIWNQDMTALLTHLTALREAGVTDLAAYLDETPTALLNMISMFRVIDINPATLLLFEGHSKIEFMQGFTSLFGQDALEVIRQELLAFWRGDTIFRSEINLKTLQGKSFPALLSYPIPTSMDEAGIVPVSIQDISELKESESRWQFAIEGSGDGLWDWNVQDNTIFYSRRWKEMLGFSDDEMSNSFHEWEKLVYPDDYPRVIANVKAHLNGNTPHFCHEYRIQNKDGSWKWVVDRGMVVTRDMTGLPLRVIGTLHDITERKNNENALLANRSQLAGMIDSAMDAIITTDSQFNIILFNQAAENMFGYCSQKVLNTPIEQLLPKAQAAKHSELMHQFAKQGDGHRKMGGSPARQVMGLHADGHEFPVEVAISYLDNFGSPIYTAMVRDITDRLAYETSLLQLATTLEHRVIERTHELEAAKLLAENATHAKSAFLANMSHEIRTPLNSVLGMAHLAQLTPLSPKQQDYLQKITLSGTHLLDLINDILDFSKIEAGKLEIHRHDFNLPELLDNVYELIQQKAEEKGLQLMITMGEPMPTFFQGDELRIKQVLLNLLSNAIKFTESGKITLSTLFDPSSDQISFSVQDTGVGITASAQIHLFQSFQQADNSITRKYGGTGLGLAISSQLVQLMGGELTVESQLDAGSEFKFSLTLPQAFSPPSQTHPAGTDIDASFLAGKRILLADDHPFNQQIGAELLQIMGADVVIANHGLEAVLLASQSTFDAILMDVQMPEMDGITACQTLRKNPEFSALPIIAMTANVSREYRQHCLNAGMNDFIGKPVQAEKLYRTLACWLGPQSKPNHDTQDLEPAELIPAPEPSTDSALINLAEMHSMLGDDPLRQRKYCAKFAQAMQEGLSIITKAQLNSAEHLSSDSSESPPVINKEKPLVTYEIAQECHRLKSIARTVGAMRLGQQLAKLEKIDPNTDLKWLLSEIKQLHILQQQSCEQLQQMGLLNSTPAPLATSNEQHQSISVLLVDDDHFMLEVIQQHLSDLGIAQVSPFLNAKSALARLAQANPPNWVFCDLQMPDMDGVAFLRQLGVLHYTGNIAILSAMDRQVLKAAELLVHSFNLSLGGVLTKPVKKSELATLLLQHPAQAPLKNHIEPELQLIEEELRSGLSKGEVELYYQPKVSTSQRLVIGAESLARWRHPTRGLLGPHLFVPAIEALGLIDELTFCVLRQAAQQLHIWQEQGEHIQLSINVSMGNLHCLELPERFAAILQENHVSPEYITLEITETQLSHDYVLSLDILTRLRIMGFGLSVDDFGTGFSTMEHLIQIPFTELKIDKAFVRGATQDLSAKTILEHSANLGRKFALNLVAEGVETQDDWDLVALIGCNEVQGYLIGRPMPAADFIQWKRKWEATPP
jgi:PAS domain S-box-containing protein